ncbi:iron-sulfur cluster assembly scaffold protein [Arhodomonas sp. SL1]|uniref:iron-sulfur cluster assembly scaffold protein n=1 Tax=Arhodomonas sp. SL1 TaxID=3425691 RepID=UPI003F8855DD
MSAHDCLERGLRTRRRPALALTGDSVCAASGLQARFSAGIEGGRIRDLRFECSACVTLIAYCQALVDTAIGQPVGEGVVSDAGELMTRVQGVPPALQDRAAIAVAAYRAAMHRAQTSEEGLQ